MVKYKFFINFEKEEKWLAEMSMQGYVFVRKGFGYEFCTGACEKANIKIDCRQFKNKNEFLDYCSLFEDSGWKHISGSKTSGTQYFVKINESAEDDIFSDNSSKAGRFRRLSIMWAVLVTVYIPLLAALIANGSVHIDTLFTPKNWYYTPGLWTLNGSEFWRAFLFETPFAITRAFIWLFFPICITLFFCFSMKAELLFRKTKGN